MQNRKIIILVIILALVVSGMAIAGSRAGWFKTSKTINELPDAKQEYKRVVDRFMGDSIINIGGAVTLCDGESPSVIKERLAYRFIKHHDQYYSQFGPVLSLCNGKAVVQLDTMNQLIMVANVIPEKGKKNRGIQPSLDVLLDENADYKIVGKVTQRNNNERSLTMQSDFNPQIKSCELTYDPKTYRIKRAVIQWWKDGGSGLGRTTQDQVWISNIEYQQLSGGDINISEEINKIITIKKDQIKPADKYQNYQLHVSNPEH